MQEISMATQAITLLAAQVVASKSKDDSQQKTLPVTYNPEGQVARIEVPQKSHDSRNTVMVMEYDGSVTTDPDAKGKYHWYTTRSKRHTKIRMNKHAGNTDLLKAVKEAR